MIETINENTVNAVAETLAMWKHIATHLADADMAAGNEERAEELYSLIDADPTETWMREWAEFLKDNNITVG